MYLQSLSTPKQIITELKKMCTLMTLFYSFKFKIIYTFVSRLKVFFNKKGFSKKTKTTNFKYHEKEKLLL